MSVEACANALFTLVSQAAKRQQAMQRGSSGGQNGARRSG